MQPLMQVKNLSKWFPVKGGVFRRTVGMVYAVKDVSFDIYRGETIGIVGESGCGKTTLGRTLVRLYEPSEGEFFFEGKRISHYSFRQLKDIRAKIQMIFQDPYGSLNPRMTVGSILEEPFNLHTMLTKKQLKEKILELVDCVGLDESCLLRYPHEFSGGQRQRVSIARAVALNPRLIVADEPVSALDVSIQSQILNLLVSLRKKFELTCLFISHDLSVVKHIANKIIVMYLGRVVEIGNCDVIYKDPKHPYTKILLDSVPKPDPFARDKKKKQVIKGDIPSPMDPPSGCVFNTRCPFVMDKCKTKEPLLKSSNGKQKVACHLYE